jgi:hypothetical protein
MSGWDIPDFLFAADEIEDLTLSQACEHPDVLDIQYYNYNISPNRRKCNLDKMIQQTSVFY